MSTLRRLVDDMLTAMNNELIPQLSQLTNAHNTAKGALNNITAARNLHLHDVLVVCDALEVSGVPYRDHKDVWDVCKHQREIRDLRMEAPG